MYIYSDTTELYTYVSDDVWKEAKHGLKVTVHKDTVSIGEHFEKMSGGFSEERTEEFVRVSTSPLSAIKTTYILILFPSTCDTTGSFMDFNEAIKKCKRHERLEELRA